MGLTSKMNLRPPSSSTHIEPVRLRRCPLTLFEDSLASLIYRAMEAPIIVGPALLEYALSNLKSVKIEREDVCQAGWVFVSATHHSSERPLGTAIVLEFRLAGSQKRATLWIFPKTMTGHWFY